MVISGYIVWALTGHNALNLWTSPEARLAPGSTAQAYNNSVLHYNCSKHRRYKHFSIFFLSNFYKLKRGSTTPAKLDLFINFWFGQIQCKTINLFSNHRINFSGSSTPLMLQPRFIYIGTAQLNLNRDIILGRNPPTTHKLFFQETWKANFSKPLHWSIIKHCYFIVQLGQNHKVQFQTFYLSRTPNLLYTPPTHPPQPTHHTNF